MVWSHYNTILMDKKSFFDLSCYEYNIFNRSTLEKQFFVPAGYFKFLINNTMLTS